jgi:hypothetical protein
MKKSFYFFCLFFSIYSLAQKPCEIDSNISDSIGTFKSTKQYLVYERSFAGNSTHLYFSLNNTNGIFGLETQFLQRSEEFIAAKCFDKSSRIYIQLNNGKIATLLYVGDETCGNYIKDEKGKNNRILSGNFVFSKDNFDDLKASPVTLIRVKFGTESIDYAFKTEITSELDKKSYNPELYFMSFLKCIEN